MAENQVDELANHIKKNLLKGYKESSIKWALINQGYSRSLIERAMRKAIKEVDESNNAQLEKIREKDRPKISYQIYDKNNKVIYGKKSVWKKLFKK